jgi:hypothetical protein
MKNILYTVVILVLTVGCQRVFEPEIEDVEPFLVVEGKITTEWGWQYIYLNNSMGYREHPYFRGVTGAVVYVEDEEGNTTYFDDKGNGAYSRYFSLDDEPEIGKTYTLKIITSDGNEYESTPQTIVPSPKITSMYCRYGHTMVLTEDSYGSPVEKVFDGIDIFHETQGILPSNNMYVYGYRAYEQHRTTVKLGEQDINSHNLYRHRCLSSKYANIIHTVDADEFGNFWVRNEELMFVSRLDMTTYYPIVPDTFIILNTFFEGLIFELKQYSVSADAFDYYSEAEAQLAAEGRMFDPASPQLTGNIICTSDSSQTVVGVFSACDVAVWYNYFHVNKRGLTNSRGLTEFPVIYLDTCSWVKPETWITPPFY